MLLATRMFLEKFPSWLQTCRLSFSFSFCPAILDAANKGKVDLGVDWTQMDLISQSTALEQDCPSTLGLREDRSAASSCHIGIRGGCSYAASGFPSLVSFTLHFRSWAPESGQTASESSGAFSAVMGCKGWSAWSLFLLSHLGVWALDATSGSTHLLPQSLSLHLRHPQLNQSHMRLKVRQTQGQGLSNLYTKVIVMRGEGAGPSSVSS